MEKEIFEEYLFDDEFAGIYLRYLSMLYENAVSEGDDELADTLEVFCEAFRKRDSGYLERLEECLTADEVMRELSDIEEELSGIKFARQDVEAALKVLTGKIDEFDELENDFCASRGIASGYTLEDVISES